MEYSCESQFQYISRFKQIDTLSQFKCYIYMQKIIMLDLFRRFCWCYQCTWMVSPLWVTIDSWWRSEIEYWWHDGEVTRVWCPVGGHQLQAHADRQVAGCTPPVQAAGCRCQSLPTPSYSSARPGNTETLLQEQFTADQVLPSPSCCGCRLAAIPIQHLLMDRVCAGYTWYTWYSQW